MRDDGSGGFKDGAFVVTIGPLIQNCQHGSTTAAAACREGRRWKEWRSGNAGHVSNSNGSYTLRNISYTCNSINTCGGFCSGGGGSGCNSGSGHFESGCVWRQPFYVHHFFHLLHAVTVRTSISPHQSLQLVVIRREGGRRGGRGGGRGVRIEDGWGCERLHRGEKGERVRVGRWVRVSFVGVVEFRFVGWEGRFFGNFRNCCCFFYCCCFCFFCFCFKRCCFFAS